MDEITSYTIGILIFLLFAFAGLCMWIYSEFRSVDSLLITIERQNAARTIDESKRIRL